MTLLSRVLGLARDIVIARFYSAGIEADAFFVAFKIPNFMRRLFAEGAFSLAFVPVLTEYKNSRTQDEIHQLINRVAGTLGLILLIITSIGVLVSPAIVYVFAAGFIDQPEKFDLTADMLRLTFPYILLISMTALAGGILNSWKQFAAPAFTPVLLNLSLIGCAVWLAPQLDVPVYALAWGVLIAGITQMLFQLPFLYKLGFLPKPVWGWKDSGVQKIIKLMIPALFGSSVAQINLLFDTFIASFLVSGSVAWLYYSDRLLEFPLGVFGIALATVVLPNLSESHVKQGKDHFNKTLNWAVQLALVIALPATLGLLLLAQPILTTMFQYGAFGESDTLMSSMSLMAYSLGLPAFILIKILANAFYARQDSKTPVRIGIIAMVVNMFLNVIFVLTLLNYTDIPAHVGLALATTGSAYCNAGLLALALRRDQYLTLDRSFTLMLLKLLLAVFGMTILLFTLSQDLHFWTQLEWFGRLFELILLILPAILCYALLLWIMGVRPRHLAH
ncbi:MAG: murein biosynthesis integral membrane protein MurJ [Gammaproteobacteria bacterium]|nr:murein biosynthesis integral membrane protein MurJ [Gammaproteobacteria bacterium]